MQTQSVFDALGLATQGAFSLVPTGQALTRVNDTNVTVTLGGTASAALLEAVSVTLGWSGQLAVGRGGTALSTVASGSVLAANALDTISAVTSTSGLKALQNNAGTVSWNTSTGTGNSVFATAPTFVTSIITPIVYGSASASGNLLLQSTSNSTRGSIQLANGTQAYTAADSISATTIALDTFTGGLTITTGTMEAVNWSSTVTMAGNGAAGGLAALFNVGGTIQDDGSARSPSESLWFACQPTYKATVASGLALSNVAGLAAITGFGYLPTTTRTGAGTGSGDMTGFHASSLATIGTGWTVTNYIGFLAEFPTVNGTLTNFYGFKSTGASGTNRWAIYESGGMQSSHKGNFRFGDNTAPTAGVDIQSSINTNQTTANGTVAVTMTSLGPTGSHTTIQEWLTIKINGTTRYIPCY